MTHDACGAREKVLAEGKVRANGVSNFMPEHLQRLLAKASVMPVVNGYSAARMDEARSESNRRPAHDGEYYAVRAKEAADNVRRAGLSDGITVISGESFKEIPTLQGQFDLSSRRVQARLHETLRHGVLTCEPGAG